MQQSEPLTPLERVVKPRFSFIEVIGITSVLVAVTWLATLNTSTSYSVDLFYGSAVHADTIGALRERIASLPKNEQVTLNNLILDAEKTARRRVPKPDTDRTLVDRMIHGADGVYMEELAHHLGGEGR